MTRPDPHASYREPVSSEAEAVDEEIKLLPCPFCGGEEITMHGERQESLGAWASCRSCGLETPTETGVTTEQATEYWNTRANEIESLRAQLATARKALEPFEAFMAGHTFEKLPDDFKITHGSSLARRQLTVGDLKKLRTALNSGEQK